MITPELQERYDTILADFADFMDCKPVSIDDKSAVVEKDGQLLSYPVWVAARFSACMFVYKTAKGYGPFICGEGGGKDDMGLPDRIFVCPQLGLDGMAVYAKTMEYEAPGW